MTTKKKAIGKSPSSTPVKGIATLFGTTTPVKRAKAKPAKYPVIEGPEVAPLVDNLVSLKRKYDAVNGPYERAKDRLKNEFGFPRYFEANFGRMDPPSSLIAYGTEDEETGIINEARVTFKDKFTPGDQIRVEKLMGELAPRYMREHVTFIIDSDLIPPEKLPEFNTELQKLMKVFGLSSALQIKPGIIPVPGFAVSRHMLEPKLNLEIQKLVLQHAAVTPK